MLQPLGGVFLAGAGSMEVIDEGQDVLSWSAGAATVTLAAPVDSDRCMLRLESGGAAVQADGWYAWLEESQIQVRSIDGLNGNLEPLSWQVVRVPTGKVQRGRDTVTATTGGTTNDINLTYPIDLDRAVISLLHRSRFLGYQTAYTYYGHLKKHATDPAKLQAFLKTSTGTQTHTLSWECWSP